MLIMTNFWLLCTGQATEHGDSVQNDAEAAHAAAESLGIDLAVVEATIMDHHGDLEAAMEVCRACPINAASWHAFSLVLPSVAKRKTSKACSDDCDSCMV